MNTKVTRTIGMKRNKGAVTVELALIAPLVFFIIFSSLEIGRAYMAHQALEMAAFNGCRSAILENADLASVKAAVEDSLSSSGISGYTSTMNPGTLDDLPQFSSIKVTITVPYDRVSLLPLPRFLSGITLEGTCRLPREATIVMANSKEATSPTLAMDEQYAASGTTWTDDD